MTKAIALTILWTVLPISELRGGIPWGVRLGLDPLLLYFVAVTANALMFFPIFFGLHLFYSRLLYRIPLSGRYLDSVGRRGKPFVDRYGFWALILFVAIPLPVTGVYTATALAWLLGLHWRKAFPPIAIGVIIAGAVVLLATLGVIRAFSVFIQS